MVKIRLKRMGAKKQAFYRIVVSDSRTKRDGYAIAELGIYDAVKNPAVVEIDQKLALEWLQKGAQPTDTVRNLFAKEGIMKQMHDLKYSKKK